MKVLLKQCRWGILSTANIARKNWKAIRQSGNGVVTAVAGRDAEKTSAFIRDYQSASPFAQTPVACTYDELLKRDDIDAVYIPLPTGIRTEWVLKAAAAGKHILCEKPCAPTAGQVSEMLAACRKANVQFMDGVMFMHSARLPILRGLLDDGQSVGKIRRIASQFSFMASDDFLKGNIRVSQELEPLGALGDLGWYNIRFSLWTMKEALPTSVSGRILLGHGRPDSGGQVPVEFSGELFYAGGVSASFYCAFVTETQQWANISGDKGFITLDDFVLPFHGAESTVTVQKPIFRVNGCEFHMERHNTPHSAHETSSGGPNSQETNMVRTFGELATGGKPDWSWGERALNTQRVLEACLTSARNQSKLVEVS